MLVKENGIHYDPEWHLNNWPSFDINSYIQVDPNADQLNFKTARLIFSNDFMDKTINVVEHIDNNSLIVATFMWTEGNNIIHVTGLGVHNDYQHRIMPGDNITIAYFMANAVRNWLLMTYKVQVVPPPRDQRTIEVEKIIKGGAIEFEDNGGTFLEESDGKYYYYSEWVQKFSI